MEIKKGVLLLKRVKQYVDMNGNIYNMSDNGNIDDMTQGAIDNIMKAPDKWFNNLTTDEYRAVDMIWGTLKNGKS